MLCGEGRYYKILILKIQKVKAQIVDNLYNILVTINLDQIT